RGAARWCFAHSKINCHSRESGNPAPATVEMKTLCRRFYDVPPASCWVPACAGMTILFLGGACGAQFHSHRLTASLSFYFTARRLRVILFFVLFVILLMRARVLVRGAVRKSNRNENLQI